MSLKHDLFDVVLDLAQAIQAAGIYPEHHQHVDGLLGRLHRRVCRATSALGTLHLGIVGDHFIVDEFPFLDMNPALVRLLREIRGKGIEKISIRDGLTFGELKRFVFFMATGEQEAAGQKWEFIAYGGIQAIGSGEILTEDLKFALPRSHVLFGATETLKGLLLALARGGPGGSVSDGRDIVASVMKGLRHDEFLIHRLMSLQAHDDYTVTHSLNVCAIVLAQAVRVGLPDDRLRDIGLAALLHDIGKEMVPPEILRKPGRLDPGEFERMSEHAAIGANRLRKVDCGTDLPMIVCYEHHMRHDLSGYPRRRVATGLHPVSLMTQIADVYDALRTYRPYRKSLDIETALSIMDKGRGSEFDPALFDNFLRTVLLPQEEAGA